MKLRPAFETERMRVRAIREEDGAPIFNAYASDPEVTRYLPWRTNEKPSETIQYARQSVAQWELGNEFIYVASLKTSGAVIGGGRIAPFRPGTGFHMEIGFVLAREYWGQGLGTEIAAALLAEAFSSPAVVRVSGLVDCRNAASCRVLEKISMQREACLAKGAIHPNSGPEAVDLFLYMKLRP